MTLSAGMQRQAGGLGFPWRLAGALICVAAAGAAAAMLAVFGLVTLVMLLIAVIVVMVVAFPRRFLLLLLAAGVIFEPGAIDYTRPFSAFLWEFPADVHESLPLTVNPFEVYLFAGCVSLLLRPSARAAAPRLPLLVWAVPAVVALGFLYGIYKGGPPNIAYNEGRGLLFSMLAFAAVLRFGPGWGQALSRTLFLASVGLALVTLQRYYLFTRTGNFEVPLEFAYAHENAVLFGIAFFYATLRFFGPGTKKEKALLVAHNLLILAATLATGRRAATLVLLTGGAAIAWQYFPRRPVQVLAICIPLAALGCLYLGAYWNKEYGALAQPARAIRSQIDPSARDKSSDTYRDVELYNVETTIEVNRVFGVGFGRTFIPFRPLPDLQDFWPLQYYTPHQNILWLWLKMGIVGISVVLGVWVLALKRALVAVRTTPKSQPVPVYALTLVCCLLIYLSYARIDHALVTTRGMAPFAVIVALAFLLPQPSLHRSRERRQSSHDNRQGQSHERPRVDHHPEHSPRHASVVRHQKRRSDHA